MIVPMDSRSSKAFTLLEVLIALAIVTLVAAISYPVFSSAKKRAKETETISNLRQSWLALELYRQDHDGTGKLHGTSSQLGLPNVDQFYLQIIQPLGLRWQPQPRRLGYGPLYYPFNPSDFHAQVDLDQQSRKLDRWLSHNRRLEERSLLVGEFNHTEGCGPHLEQYCLFLGFGIRLDGSTVRRQSTGKINEPEWWE